MTTYNKIIIADQGNSKFAFTLNDKNKLVYQELGNQNQLYFSDNPNEGGNLYNDWDHVDFMGLEENYAKMVNQALDMLN